MRQSLRQKPMSRFIAPACVVLFLALTLVGTYYLRRNILERTMLRAMDIGDGGMMRRTARSWPAPVAVTDGERRTPLHLAALIGDNDLIAALVTAGADARARDKYGCSPIHYARTIPVARALLDAGTPVDVRNANDETPLHHAAATFARHDAKWYVKPMSTEELRRRWPGFYKSPWGPPELIEFYLSRGAAVNAMDNRPRTPLRNASTACANIRPAEGPMPSYALKWQRIVDILKSHGGLDGLNH